MRHRTPHTAGCLLVAVLGLCLVPGAGQASRQSPAQRAQVAPTTGTPTVQVLASELGHSERARRLLAARELKRQARNADRATDTARSRTTMRGAEALQTLQDIDLVGAPACTRALEQPELRRPCAKVLATVAHEPALGPLCAAAAAEDRAGVQRVLTGAAASIAADHGTPWTGCTDTAVAATGPTP